MFTTHNIINQLIFQLVHIYIYHAQKRRKKKGKEDIAIQNELDVLIYLFIFLQAETYSRPIFYNEINFQKLAESYTS